MTSSTAASRGSEVLVDAMDRHGAQAWRTAGSIQAELQTGGLLWATRGRRGFRGDALVATRTVRTVLNRFPGDGRRGVFEPGRVWIETNDGRVAAERFGARELFSKPRRRLYWDDLDLLYFVGYALWNYLNAPFLLAEPGFEVRELEPGAGGDSRALAATFPPDVPTHCREQVFHFDANGLLSRLDYTAEVVGGWARAAHTCAEYRDFSGLWVAKRRRVTPRTKRGHALGHPTLVSIDIADARLHGADETAPERRALMSAHAFGAR